MKKLLHRKVTNITYSDSLFVALVIQHTARMYRIVICGLPDCAIFVHIISQSLDFRKKKKIVHEMRVFILSTILSETFLILCRNE